MLRTSIRVRRVFLGGVALGLIATGAEGDELTALKTQLEALQSRVHQLEAPPAANAPSGLPQSDGLITFHRGSDIGWDQTTHARPQEYIPEDRGFTIAITPSADLPAPVHEVSVSGYIKGDFIYDTRQDLGDTFGASVIDGTKSEHVRLHARQSRFRIRSKSDTSVGQVRTLIEGDFFGAGGDEVFSNSTALRLRHAWGEWDIAPNTTIGIGQTWTNFMNLFALPDTVDFMGPAGHAFKRQGQIRLTHRSGPILFAVSVENPETDITSAVTLTEAEGRSAVATVLAEADICRESAGFNGCEVNDNVPDFTARLQYDAPGGHRFQVSGVLKNMRIDGDLSNGGITGSDSATGWGLLGAASFNLADIATLAAMATYGDGLGSYLVNGGFASATLKGTLADPKLKPVEVWSVVASLAMGVTDTTTLNVAVGHYNQSAGDSVWASVKDVTTVHANLIWQPDSRFRMGAEGIWGTTDVIGFKREDALRFQFGAWFFF